LVRRKGGLDHPFVRYASLHRSPRHRRLLANTGQTTLDAHKLDISDELKNTIDALKGHDDKIRCILNKADQIDRQQLMRVYGALLWSLGKTMSSPEVARVYVGSFWEQQLQNTDNALLFEMEEKELMRVRIMRSNAVCIVLLLALTIVHCTPQNKLGLGGSATAKCSSKNQ
jgi:hypothetical protein